MSGPGEREVIPDGRDPAVLRVVEGPFLKRFRIEGGTEGLGAPLSDVEPVSFAPLTTYGDLMMRFERGTIFVDSRTGDSSRPSFGWYAYVPLRGVERSGGTP